MGCSACCGWVEATQSCDKHSRGVCSDTHTRVRQLEVQLLSDPTAFANLGDVLDTRITQFCRQECQDKEKCPVKPPWTPGSANSSNLELPQPSMLDVLRLYAQLQPMVNVGSASEVDVEATRDV